ncbi:MAG: hypothetical protein PHQ80_03770 [Candidatus ainarchaeum sp.]|nr:hypothetical protein [Candidatus ainarchaeum sp.]MDD5096226.1 hypothetical protein [Candidatus ainarchaeum sp.]
MSGTAIKLALFAIFIGIIAAQSDFSNGNSIKEGICMLADTARAIMASVIFALIIMAAVVYAAGQVFGAETRSRATVWATAMLIGAVIGILIYVLVPQILDTFAGVQVDVQGAC